MAHKPDAVTSWWRRISLRAKVTGVTVALLALGLLIAGIGTVPLLRSALVANIDGQLPAVVSSDLVNRYLDVTTVDGATVYTPKDEQPRDFFFAIYNAEGALLATAGSTTSTAPLFDQEFSLQRAQANEDKVFDIFGADGRVFRAAVATVTADGGALQIQVVALPVAAADHEVPCGRARG